MNIILHRTADLSALILPETLHAPIYEGEDNAHSFVIHAERNGAPEPVTGSVVAFFERSDGNTVRIEGSIENGAACITLPAECYRTGVFYLALTNGYAIPVTLPSFSASHTAFNSSHQTTVNFYSDEIAGARLYAHPVDASSVYQDGVTYGKSIAEDVTLSSAGWINGVNTVTASNGATYPVSLPPFSTSTNGGFTSSHKMIVFFRTPSVTQPLEHYTVDASSVYTEGYNAGYNAGWAAAREEVRRVTNSAGTEVYIYGPSETVNASARFYTVGLNVAIPSHTNVSGKITAEASASVLINSSSAITKTASSTIYAVSEV